MWASGDGGEEDDCNCDGYVSDRLKLLVCHLITISNNYFRPLQCGQYQSIVLSTTDRMLIMMKAAAPLLQAPSATVPRIQTLES